MGKKGGNHLPTVAVRWHHMFSVAPQRLSFLSSFFCVWYEQGQFIQNLA